MTDDSVEFTPKELIELLRKRKALLQQQRHGVRLRWSNVLAGCVVGAIVIGNLYESGDSNLQIAVDVFWGLLGGFAAAVALLVYLRLVLMIRERQVDTELLKVGAAQLQETIEQDFVTKLIQINFKYIDQYYEQTQNQASKSFVLSACASVVGLAIVITGIVMMFRSLTTPAYLTDPSRVLWKKENGVTSC